MLSKSVFFPFLKNSNLCIFCRIEQTSKEGYFIIMKCLLILKHAPHNFMVFIQSCMYVSYQRNSFCMCNGVSLFLSQTIILHLPRSALGGWENPRDTFRDCTVGGEGGNPIVQAELSTAFNTTLKIFQATFKADTDGGVRVECSLPLCQPLLAARSTSGGDGDLLSFKIAVTVKQTFSPRVLKSSANRNACT